MKHIFSNKIIKYLFISILIIIVCCIGVNIGLGIYLNTPKVFDLTSEYRTDIEPLVKRFGDKIEFDSCYWKADTIGKTNFGPTSFWLKGFIMLKDDSFQALKSQYELTSVDLDFEEGMEPDITGFETFEWCYSEQMSHDISGVSYMGNFYLDICNGVLYFDLESM